ncbi:hypothetical protein SBOR_3836 [Sclerotinia borealis F-4128]|uniref:Uncharacterized protein n=1 Tax=Sclerotinia borealis (strain F-4128) TaxID=1432307 RepID=W9CMG5_SCLBF|nr:hypothetical protein SBOR_3836 [Sclerotinia borealis F-4128]
MELDDRWDPDPLPNSNPRNQPQPRSKGQAVRNSRAQPQYYQPSHNSHPQETNRNARMNSYDNLSDEDSSSNGYPGILHQPQANPKRARGPSQVVPDRRKRHQSEHPSGHVRSRTTGMDEAMFDHSPVTPQSRNKSVARSEIRYKATEDNLRYGYQDVGNTIPTSRKSVASSHSRTRNLNQNQDYMATDDYNEEITRDLSLVASNNNNPVSRRIKGEAAYSSVLSSTFSHESTGQGPQKSSRFNRESATPKPRQRLDSSRSQDVAARSMYDDGGIFYPGTENNICSAKSQRQRQKPQLGSPLWPSHESSIQKPLPAHRLEGNLEMPTSRNSNPSTPRQKSMGRRPVVPNGTQIVAGKPRTYDYGFIPDDDVNDTPLENALRSKSKAQVKLNSSPMNILKGLPTHSIFQRNNSQTAKQSYETPPRNSNRTTTSEITIDLVTPESTVSARGSMPFLPKNWTPTMKRPVKVLTPLKYSMQDSPSAGRLQKPEEDIRQRQAAEKIVRQELNAEREALQKDLFGEVVRESEEEKREREEAKRIEAQKAREEEEKQLAIDAEVKRRKAEARAQKEREKKAAEQLEKGKEAAARKAKRDAERHHQSIREEQAAVERRKAAKKVLQEKKEREMALLRVVEEQKQIAEKERKEQAAKFDQMARSMQKLAAQITVQTVAALKPARKSTADSGTAKPTEAPVPLTTLPTSMEVDDEDSLFLPETEKATVAASPDQQMSHEPQIQNSSSDVDSTTAQSVEQDRAPASIAEIFANAISKPSSDNVLDDREAEREAIRKERADERAAAQRKQAKSALAEVSPKPPARKSTPSANSKAPSKAVPKKKAAQSLTKSPGDSIFGFKLKPLHGPDAFLPCEQPDKSSIVAEKPNADIAAPKSRPLPLPPLLPPTYATTTSNSHETRLISQEERDEIEAGRERIQAEAKAQKDALAKQRAEAKKEEAEKKRTVEYRKKKEKQLRDQAHKDGKVFGDFELESIIEKLMDKRERDKKRRNQRRAGENVSLNEHDEPISNPNLPNVFGTTSAQASSSDTASDFNHMDEEEDPETQARKEHEARTAESLKALAQSRAARRSHVSPVEKLGPLFSDESSESEEDPDDDETMEAMIAHARKNNPAKLTEDADELQPGAPTEEELALERDLEAAFEEELIIEDEGEVEGATAQLNPDDYGTQIVAPMPDMTSFFQGSSTQQSSHTMGNRSTQRATPSQITQPAPTKPQKPASYKMVNVYMVMTQIILHDHEDEATLKKKFLDVDKANKFAQTLVNEYRAKKHMQQEIVEKWDKEYKYSSQITHDNHKTTKVFIKAVPMNPQEIDKYDPREIHPKFANQYYTVRFEKQTEQRDPETNEVHMTHCTVGFADASKLYTALEMANHAAGEYLLQETKPKEEVEEHHTSYEEDLIPQVRSLRDQCDKEEQMFCCELESDSLPWADFKSLEVRVEISTTEGPIN